MRQNFGLLIKFVPRKKIVAFYLITFSRVLSNGLDLVAIATIWLATNSVVSGYTPNLQIGGVAVLKAAPVDEVTVLGFGILSLALFLAKGVFGMYSLRLLRNLAVDFEISIMEKMLRARLANEGGVTKARAIQPQIHHAITSIRLWVTGGVTQLSSALSEISLIVSLAIFMVLSSTFTSILLLSILIATALLINNFVGSGVTKNSRIYRDSTLDWTKDLSDALAVRTHLTLSGRDNEWLAGMVGQYRNAAKAFGTIILLNSLPRYALEIAALMAVSITVGASFILGDFAENAAGAAVILASAFRISGALLPLQASYNSMIQGLEQGKVVQKEFEDSSKDEKHVSEAAKRIRTRLDAFWMSPETKRIIVITGPSGIGKSTAITGALMNRFEALGRGSLGFAGQDPALLSGGVSRNIFFEYEKGVLPNDAKLNELATKLGMTEVFKRLSEAHEVDGSAISLSGGELTKLEIIRAHVKNPSLILMDEPSTGLDGTSKKALAELVNNSQAKYVIVTHDDELMEYLDSFTVLTAQ